MRAKSMRPNANQRAGNSAPTNRKLREPVNLQRLASSPSPTVREADIRKIEKRSRRLTLCMFCFVAALSSLLPFASLHLSQRVGLLLFESDLIQLRSSLFAMLICFTVLVILHILIKLLASRDRKTWMTQRSLKQLIALSASTSAISYLSIAFVVPQVRQVQRMPLATFDCKANLITIENCHQQFTAKGGEQTIYEASRELLSGHLDGNSERLIKKLDCLKFNDRELETLEVPTRFLLHNCGLVCKPQRQQLHQFGDDLNREQNHWSQPTTTTASELETSTASSGNFKQPQRLIPPYHHNNILSEDVESAGGRHYIYHNASSPSDQFVKAPLDSSEQKSNQVSIKVCFSGEFSGGTDNYKQFCITNLANNGHLQEHTLTVGQLNAMLRRFISSSPASIDQDEQMSRFERQIEPIQEVDDQTTHYVNPVVQFESHFKNWPHLPTDQAEGEEGEDSWCKFRPIPPFIVNNKPFSDIQCALEQEYTMTTGPNSADSFSSSADKIYLKKSSLDLGNGENLSRERCNIQCKVNILYQVHVDSQARRQRDELKSAVNKLHYYLPLKPCIVVSGEGDKAKTLDYYMFFKTLGDSTLLLAFILLDLFLLLESIDTKQFQLEAKKLRLISLLAAFAIMPLLIAFLFDTMSLYYPPNYNKSRREGYLTAFLYERVLPTLSDLFSGSRSKVGSSPEGYSGKNSSSGPRLEASDKRLMSLLADNYLIPFSAYSVLMFILAIFALTIPIVSSSSPLQRVASTEELGMTSSRGDKAQSSKVRKKPGVQGDLGRQQGLVDRRKLGRKLIIQMISLYLVALFMGTQFNLSQFTQMQIFIESFGNPVAISNHNSYSTLWFVLGTQSGVAVFILLLTLVFLDEISSFFAAFSPFKATLSASSDNQMAKQNRAKFLNYLTLSLIIYSVRYFAIANMTAVSRFRWVVLFLFQLAELFNFPITWFVLTNRAHELATTYRARNKLNKNQTESGGPASNSKCLDSHVAIQSTMALTYFAIGKSMALFTHSLYASLHLHSDNVDWFITSFYRPSSSDMKHSTSNVGASGSSSNGLGASMFTASSYSQINNSSASGSQLNGKPDSLFSPLPGERQTYLHASRLFLRYNSLLCLLLGLVFLLTLLYVKYQIWAEQRRTFDLSKAARMAQEDDSIDEQLSLDLMRIQASNTRNIYPDAMRKGDTGGAPSNRPQSPRAKILFHYNLGLNETQSESSPPASDWEAEAQRNGASAEVEYNRARQISSEELRIPIAIEEEAEEGEFEDQVPMEERILERVVRNRSKKVRIFEDSETWPKVGDLEVGRTSPTRIGDNLQRDSIIESSERSRKRSITFAPVTTLIGNDGSRKQQREQVREFTVKRASPDPSIAFESDNEGA